MSGPKHTALGSGLFASDGSGYNSPQKPDAFPLPDWRYQAVICGVENGVVVRSWSGPAFDSRDEALNAAIAKATGEGQ